MYTKGLWGLVNNAGMLQIGPIEWQSLDDFRRIADVNLWGTIAVTKTFLPLVKHGKGRIVNMGSTACKCLCLPVSDCQSDRLFLCLSICVSSERLFVSVCLSTLGYFRQTSTLVIANSNLDFRPHQ